MPFKNIHKILFYSALASMLLNIQCESADLTDNTYFDSKVMILGHRGMGVYYQKPGNTWESILPAIMIGADGCEVDIQITRDSVPVLYHDHYLDSRTGCTGRIYEHTWAEIKNCEYAAIQEGIHLISVDELFNRVENINTLYFSFDCKPDDETGNPEQYRDQFLRAIQRVCEQYAMTDHVFLEGGLEFLSRAKELGLKNKLFWASGVDEETIEIACQHDFTGISSQVGNIVVNTDLAHERGLYIMAYSPYNFYLNLNALEKNIDILQTDDPGSVLKYFGRYNYEYIIPE